MTIETAFTAEPAPSTGRARRIVWIIAALVLQVALVAVAVAPQLSARLTGDEYRLLVGPVDPIDPFRGSYVVLGYPGLPAGMTTDGTDTVVPVGTVFVPLVHDESSKEGVWKGTTIDAEPPASGPFIRCENRSWTLTCGIDSWFVPQDRALEIERTMRGGHAIAVVRIDSGGRAAIVDLQPVAAESAG